MAKKKTKSSSHFPTVADLIANATDFLRSATADLKTRPKHSVIAFHTAIELILKARLMAEHWTLVVSRNADRDSFARGDFVSVSFDEACSRLKTIIGSPLPEDAKGIFDGLRRHRNKMVHFYHEGETDENTLESIALEQLHGWRALVSLMENQWQSTFADMAFDITAIDDGFAEHRLYAKAKFESLTATLTRIVDRGGSIERCGSCAYDAAERNDMIGGISSSQCLVCRAHRRWIVATCPSCAENLMIEGDDGAVCGGCDSVFSVDDLVEALNEESRSPDEYQYAVTPANCAACDGYHTVISWNGDYVCLACLVDSSDIGQCGWCGEGNNGPLEGSGLHGCSACDGNVKVLYD